MLRECAPDASLIPNASTIGMSSERKNFLISGERGAAAVTNVMHWSRPSVSCTLLNTRYLAILYPKDEPSILKNNNYSLYCVKLSLSNVSSTNNYRST